MTGIRSKRLFTALLPSVLLVACLSSKATDQRGSQKKSSRSCDDEVAELHDWLAKALNDAPNCGSGEVDLVALANAPILAAYPKAALFLSTSNMSNRHSDIQKTMARLSSHAMANPSESIAWPELSEAFTVENHQRRLREESTVKKVIFSVTAKTPWAAVVATAKTFEEAGVEEVGFAFAVGDSLPKPSHSSLSPSIEGFLKTGRGALLEKAAELWRSPAIATCQRLARVPEEVSGIVDEQKHRLLRGYVRESIKACNCRTDIPSVKSVIFAVHHYAPCGVIWRRIAANGMALKLPSRTSWSDAFRTVVDSKGTAPITLAGTD